MLIRSSFHLVDVGNAVRRPLAEMFWFIGCFFPSTTFTCIKLCTYLEIVFGPATVVICCSQV